MKSLLKLTLGLICALTIFSCSSQEDEEVFQEAKVNSQKAFKNLDSGGEHDWCRDACE